MGIGRLMMMIMTATAIIRKTEIERFVAVKEEQESREACIGGE